MSEKKNSYAYGATPAEREKLRALARAEKRSMSEEISFLVDRRIKELALEDAGTK